MNKRCLLLGLIIFIFLFLCLQRKEKTFEEKAKEALDKIEYQRKSEVELENYSSGVQEVIENYDYVDPLVATYTETKIVASSSDLHKIETQNPTSIKSIYFSPIESINIKDISVFRNLEHLKIIGLDSLPNGFYNLKKLRALKIGGGSIKIDKRILNLSNLEYLEFMFTDVELPSEIEKLEKLRAIRMPYCNYKQPYKSITNLSNLQYLAIRFPSVEQLKGIGNLKNLKTLSTNVVSPEIGKLQLTGLILDKVKNNEYPQELEQLQSLVALGWWSDHKRNRPPNFISKLKNLEYLEIRNCSNFNEIPIEFDELKRLIQFNIYCGKDFNCKIDHLKRIQNKINIK